jgi:hypothetical protein
MTTRTRTIKKKKKAISTKAAREAKAVKAELATQGPWHDRKGKRCPWHHHRFDNYYHS